MAFATAISHQIPGFTFGFQGSCIYRNERSLKDSFNAPLFKAPPASESEAEEWADNLERRIHEDARLEPYFLKPLRYAHQNEYRFIWCVSQRTDDCLDIACQEALKFCEKA